MTQFFVPKTNITETRVRITDRDDVHHAKHVLRMKEGERIRVSDMVDTEYICEVESIDDEIDCRILEMGPFKGEPKISVTLYQGYPKADKMENIVQKCTELGVKEIVPIYMARSVVRDNGKGEKKQNRMQKIADEASKQCKRGLIPGIREAVPFRTILGELERFDLVLIPYEDEKGTTIKEILRDFKEKQNRKCGCSKNSEERNPGEQNAGTNLFPNEKPDKERATKIAFVIGPEGGFEEEEVTKIREKGGVAVSLGKTILRTETAGPVCLSMILYELEM